MKSLSAVLILLFASVGPATAQSLPDQAREMLGFYSAQPLLPGTSERFELNIGYPAVSPPARQYPWEGIDFTTQPEAYARSIFQYILADQELVAADFDVTSSTRWFHAPWLPRENIHGMTAERRSDPGELALGSPDGIENWAVAVYNDVGGYTLGRVWADALRPDARAARFGVGTLTFKLLFTEAPPAQVSYLAGSKKWDANIRPASGKPVEMRLLQLDFAVRDARADQTTGWVFGTFMYMVPAGSGESTAFDWANMVPVGITWGADPALLGYDFTHGAIPQEGWMNPVVEKLFAEIRVSAAGFESPHLGLFGRANGPVDDPRSSCLACHGRALDWGQVVTNGYRNAVMPFSPRIGADDFSIQWFFRNLKSDEPFLRGKTSLDYSLQLEVGIRRFGSWLATQPTDPVELRRQTGIKPLGLELELPVQQFERGN